MPGQLSWVYEVFWQQGNTGLIHHPTPSSQALIPWSDHSITQGHFPQTVIRRYIGTCDGALPIS